MKNKEDKPKHKKVLKYMKTILAVFGVWLLINGIIYVDIYLRAKSAYKKGIMYLKWHENPALKEKYLKNWRDKEISKIKGNDYKAEVLRKAIEVQYQMRMEENPLKNAYFWFRTVVDCFSPPETKYVKLSKEKLKTITPLLEKNK
ncbi:MAG: hypothetical protein J7L42_06720 [Elusimicrobia bacterium]|nr:hypothetical protein [Elusimicrobiota bacterium]